MSSKIWLLQLFLIQFYVSLLHAISPPPVQCYGNGCTVDNYQGLWMDHTPCKAANVVYPTTEEELVKAMAEAVKRKQKMKVVSKGSHTLSKFVCPGGDDGLLISTRDYSTTMFVNQSAMTLTANAGVQLRTLIDYAAEFGLALPYTTYWDGVSIAGVVSTGAHGSGLWNKGSALHEYITGMRLAVPSTEEEGYVRIISLTDLDEDLDAARVSLGVLGVILQVTFALHPMFKRSVSLEARADDVLEEDVLSFAQAHEFGDITWYPSIRKVLYRLDDLVSVDSPGDGINKYQGFQGIPVSHIEQARRGEEFLEKTRNAAAACKISEILLSKRVSDGNGFLNDGSSFTGFPVVGFNHLMQASGGCQDPYSAKQQILTATGVEFGSSCASQNKDGTIDETLPDSALCYWDPRINSSMFYQTAIAVSLAKVSELILDIKKVREIDPNGLCGLGLYGGIMLRYMKKSRAFLGISEDVVDIDFTYFRSRDANSPRLNGDVMEEIEQMLMEKYDGQPHWAKNRDVVFYDGVAARRRNNLEKFLQVKQRFDPDGLFSSEWSDVALGLNKLEGDLRSAFKFENKCALGGLCICFEDRHCDPDRGYFCRPGKIYKDARVCRFEVSTQQTISSGKSAFF